METVIRQRTTEAEIEDVTKRYGTKHSAAKPTRNNEQFTQICTRFGKKVGLKNFRKC